jgi:hypothetical protein
MAGAKEFEVLKLAALLVASAAATTAVASSTDTLVSNSPWWEKVTVSMDGNGNPEACRYETSLKPADAQACNVDSGPPSMVTKASASKGEVTRITFERRFTPGAQPVKPDMQTGDTLLGGQIMALAIDARGAVKGCKVIAKSGSMQPEYGCDEATAEKFQASVGGAEKIERQGTMTILVYGHTEHMV